MPRWLITLLVVVIAALIITAMMLPPPQKGGDDAGPPSGTISADDQPAPSAGNGQDNGAAPGPSDAAPGGAAPTFASGDFKPIEGLRLAAPPAPQGEAVIGSASPDRSKNPYAMRVEFTPYGAGVRQIVSSRFSKDVAHDESDFEPFLLQDKLFWKEVRLADGSKAQTYRYPLAAQSIIINGSDVPLYAGQWTLSPESDASHAIYEATIMAAKPGEDAEDRPILSIRRTWRLEPNDSEGYERFDLRLEQRFENLSDQPLRIRFRQYGPFDMPYNAGFVGDQRRVIIGYLEPRRASDMKDLVKEDYEFLRSNFVTRETDVVWPDPEGDPKRELGWAAMTGRYFAVAVHGAMDPSQRNVIVPLEGAFERVERVRWGSEDDAKLGLMLESVTLTLSPADQRGDARHLDLDLFAGPKQPELSDQDSVYSALNFDLLIVYDLGGCCALCTFVWLAKLLLGFMKLIASLVGDWGVAIIVLVAVVRLILHPLTKGAQVNMMKVSKQMQALQPEIEKLKAKYKNNQQKLNQEMMQLFREKGVNPMGMGLGCLPMFLQMPIWVALYAMLYFAIELRHESAFWGVFQHLTAGAWGFLEDLSSQDNFLALPGEGFTIPLIGAQITALNILPILMGVVFFVQQKYTTAATPPANEDVARQQAMMKWMVMLFPIFLYKAPSGLTLYILTSTAVGIIESKRVRDHVKQLEESGELHKPKQRKEGGFMDRIVKAAEARQKMIEESRNIQKQQQGGGEAAPDAGTSRKQRSKRRKKR